MTERIIEFENEEHAQSQRYYQWDDFKTILGNSCDGTTAGALCGNTYECVDCKWTADERKVIPTGTQAAHTTHLKQMLQALGDAQRVHGWVKDNPIDTLQALYDLTGTKEISAQVRNNLSNWGEVAIPKEYWRLVPVRPSAYNFHEIKCRIGGGRN